MTAILAPDYGTDYPASRGAVEPRLQAAALAEEFVARTLELSRELPRGVRAPSVVQLAKDIARGKIQPSLANLFRLILGCIRAGQNAALYGEAFADVLGACAATVLPVSDASLAECLAESQTNPIQALADRPDATPEQVLNAARHMEEEARAASDAARSYRRRWREMVRRESGL